MRNARNAPKVTILTPRERQVAQLLADGYSGPEIAKELGIATTTVRTYVDKIARYIPGRGPSMRRIALWYARETRGK